MNDLLNPYIAGAPVVEASMFFGREDVFTWIENSLSGKFVDHILVLHGQRRVGKTSVLKQIPNFLAAQYVQVFFDLQGRTNTTMDRFLWWMASEIVRTLNKEHEIDLPRPKRDAFADPEAFITEFIPALQAVMGEKVLLLTFDEFDTLDRPDIQDSLARPLIVFLRRLFEVDGFNFIFSIGSSGNKLENMQAAYTDFFKTALYRKVSFLTRDECHSLITRPVTGVIEYEPEAIEQIIAITSGHPYFTQLTCHELFARCQKTGSRVVTAADVAEKLDDVIERGTVNLKFVWDEASDLEKWILAALGQEEGLSLKGISQLLKTQGVRFIESDLNSAVLHLRDKDVLNKDNHFVIQLMKRWLETNRPMDRVREELVQANPIADRYIEIGDEYRDRQQFQQALASYQQALAAQPNSLLALYNMGGIHQQAGEYQLAADAFLKALRVDDEHIAARQGYCQAQLGVGNIAKREGSTTAAIEAFQAILNINPTHAEARQNLADIYRAQAEVHLASGSDQKALDRLRLAMEMTPEDDRLEARYQVIIAERKAALVADWLDKAGKALRRKRWDEAAQLAEEALKVDPADQAVQRRLVEIKDAPRVERLKAYKGEAEVAIAKGQYPKAISALEMAVLLAPEDKELAAWLQAARGDQQHAQLRMVQAQAAQAEAAGDWAGVVAAREAALKLNPNDQHLAQALADAKTAFQQARKTVLRGQVDSARQAERWDEAVGALQELLVLTPTDPAAQAELEHLLAAQQKAKLAALLTQAEEAAQQEHWDKALACWGAYLEELPEEAEKLEPRQVKARKYAQLSADYTAAQDHMRKRQYGRAISKLQGILAQEPTYKATSRLLVEAVEASKQRQPIYRQPWLYGVIGMVLLVSLGIIFNRQILSLFSKAPSQAQVDDMATKNPAGSGTSADQSSPQPESGGGITMAAAFSQPILTHILSVQPDFVEDFSLEQPYWDEIINSNEPGTAQFIDEAFVASGEARYWNNDLHSDSFVLQYDFSSEHNRSATLVLIHSGTTNYYYEFYLYFSGVYNTRKTVKGTSTYFRDREWSKNVSDLIVNGKYHARVQLIAHESTLAIYVNDQLFVFEEGLELNNMNFQIGSIVSEGYEPPQLDNIHYWDIADVMDLKSPPYALAHRVFQVADILGPSGPDFGLPLAEEMSAIYVSENQSVADLVEDGALKIRAEGEYFEPYFSHQNFYLSLGFIPQTGDPQADIAIVSGNQQTGEDVQLIYRGDGSWNVDQNQASLAASPSEPVGLQEGLSYRLDVIVYENTYAVFLNHQPVVYLDNFNNLDGEVEQRIKFGEQLQADFQYIFYTGLDGIDIDNPEAYVFLNQILAYINRTPPTHQNYFSEPNPDWIIGNPDYVPLDNFVSDGAVHINHTNTDLNASDVSFPRDPLTAKNSVISFVVDAKDFDVPAVFAVRQQWSYDDPRYPMVYFMPWDNHYSFNDLEGFIDLSKRREIYIINFDQRVTIIADGKIIDSGIVSGEYSGEITHFTIEKWGNEQAIQDPYQIIFDDIRFWNLDGVEFDDVPELATVQMDLTPPLYVDSILDYINTQAPTFDGTLSQHNHLRYGKNFVILSEFMYEPHEDYGVWGVMSIRLFADEAKTEFLSVNFFGYFETWTIVHQNLETNNFSIIDNGHHIRSSQKKVLVISYQDYLAIYLDDLLISFIPVTEFSNHLIFLDSDSITSEKTRFWNLEGIEF